MPDDPSLNDLLNVALDAAYYAGRRTLAHFNTRVAVETKAEGSYNLAPEIWLMEGGQSSVKADPRRITAEVMFWMDYKDGARPAGEIISTPTLDGVTY